MRAAKVGRVALLAEGVDRNFCRTDGSAMIHTVALLAEGVDRNCRGYLPSAEDSTSPSSRRAWIEIHRWLSVRWPSACRPPRGGRG